MRPAISTVLTTATLAFALGCASQAGSDDRTGGPGGGKADDTTEGGLTELSEEGQGFLRAADAECLHVHHTDHDAYPAMVKLICMPRGGVAAPTQMFLAAVSPGEIGAIYKVYEVPGFIESVPHDVAFRMDGDTATLSYLVQVPDFVDDHAVYTDKRVTVTLAFSGDPDAPDVATTYASE